MLKPSTRPARGEIDEAALGLARRHGAQILATARRYAATPEDAEDAYQRGLEILLTKAPTTREEELVPWLKTVVKHEAFALRRQRDRHSPVTDDGHLSDRPTPPAITHDQAERLETLSQGAEALARLKPHEIRALVLKAEGYSYREICELTGWSYTKVNRLLTEGRRAFLRRVAAIQGGGECDRLAPLLSALADGEASAEQLALLRPHMRTCLACRAALREFRALPAKVAALVPPAGLPAANVDGRLRGFVESTLANVQERLQAALGGAQQKADSALGTLQHKSAALGERAHAAVELAAGQKLAAVAASAAALAGGGTAVDHFANHGVPPPAQQEQQRVDVTPVKEEAAIETSPAPADPAPAPAPAEPDPAAQQPAAPQPQAQPAPAPPPPPPPDPSTEFAPSAPAAAPAPAPAAPAATAAPVAPASGGPAPSGGGGGDAAREFAP
jgi:RNA polymerase sigma factor (sigma-70 family)